MLFDYNMNQIATRDAYAAMVAEEHENGLPQDGPKAVKWMDHQWLRHDDWIPNMIVLECTDDDDQGKRAIFHESFVEMLELEEIVVEKVDSSKATEIKKALEVFIKKHGKHFVDDDAQAEAKKIAADVSKMKDEVEVINRLADLSNLLKDSEKYSKELEAIINLV